VTAPISGENGVSGESGGNYLTHPKKAFPRSPNWLTVASVESHGNPELVPVEELRSGDPITDVNGGGQHYTVLESKAVDEDCVVLELESKANHRLRVIEMSFPTGYHVGRSPRRIL
jgi:hypothetical protein